MTPLYEIRGARRTFSGRDTLSIEYMRLERGRMYALLGPNGAGKTTLLKSLALLEPFSAGELYFQGELATAANMALLRSRVVWVPQTPVLFSGSLRYNIEYPLRLRAVEKTARARRAEELMESVGLLRLAENDARTLSGGEAMRASIARALAAGAEVLLLDEPTAGVDKAAKAGLEELIHTVWRACALSILIATHDVALAKNFCQECIYLESGRLVSGLDSKSR